MVAAAVTNAPSTSSEYYPPEKFGTFEFFVLDRMRGYGNVDHIRQTENGLMLYDFHYSTNRYTPKFPVDSNLFNALLKKRAVEPSTRNLGIYDAGPRITEVWSQADTELQQQAHARLIPGTHSKWSSIFFFNGGHWIRDSKGTRYYLEFYTPLNEVVRVYPCEDYLVERVKYRT